MAEPTPSHPEADRNLLFGVLALRMDLLRPDDLIAGMQAWASDTARPLGQVFVEQSRLSPDQRRALDALVEEHLRSHRSDPRQSLAALPPDATARHGLDGVAPAGDTVPETTRPDDPRAGDGAAWQRYRVLRPHARGGLGEVLVAEDTELHRQVALKEIQARYAQDAASRSRFVLEAEVTGNLEHPGVVPVYGLGTYPDGRPFYAMRLVRGEDLRDAIRRFHEADTPGRDPGERRLALRQLLNRFVAVCNAVAYAHSRGVVHRDLKPGNIMLGRYSETLVIDWGLAKVTGRPESAPAEEETLPPGPGGGAVATAPGAAVGTPPYMSPEQAAGRPDRVGPASDVYSLGATLYTLLTGEPPFPKGDTADLLEKVRRGEVVPPRQVKPDVPAALDAVCRRAMALRPEDRYPSALALAADVEHWLADEPVAAYPEPWAVRAGRWLRRRKALASAVAAALLGVALVGGGGWLWYRHEEGLRATRAAGRANEALADASRLWGQARAARDPAAWAQAQAAAGRARELASAEGAGDELRRRAEELQAGLDEEAREGERDRRMLARLEEVRIRRAEVRADGFDFASAVPAYAEAFRDYGLDVEALEPEAAGAEVRRRAIRRALVAALDEWAWIRSKAESDPAGWRRLLAVARAADPDPWRNRLRDALSRHDVPALKDLAATANAAELPAPTLELLGHALGQAGAVPEAVALLRRAQRQYPGDFWINQYLAFFLASHRPPQWDEAIRFYSVALALRGDSPGVYVNYGLALERKGALDEAVLAYERAVALKGDYAAAHLNLGLALRRRGEPRRAADALKKAVRLKPRDAKVYSHLGFALARQEALGEAADAFREALRLQPDHVEARIGLGIAQARRGQLADAIATFKEACRRQPDNAEAHAYLGGVLSNHGDLDAALDALGKAVRLKPDLALAHKFLGVTLERKKRLDDAVAAYRKAIRLKPDDAEAHLYLGQVWKAKGRWDDALASFREAVRLKPEDAEGHFQLGILLADRKRDDAGAVAEFRKAIRLRPDYAEAHCNLGHVLRKQGRFAEALEATRRGHEIGSKRPGWAYPSARWVKESERLVELDRKLAAIRRGDAAPAGAEERIELARFCAITRHYATAARFCEEAFAARPGLAEDPWANNRYNAACMAVLASAGRGADAASLDGPRRLRWRQKALEWLRADLARMGKDLERQPAQGRVVVRVALPNWQADPSLAAVRDESALAKLPEAERKAWRQLWADVAALLGRAREQK
jgi:eukaryotic-like serine/threonine-protein kinase